jgi:hypothetical protein
LNYFKVPRFDLDTLYSTDLKISQSIGKLIIWGLVKVLLATEESNETYYLTDLGIKMARKFE